MTEKILIPLDGSPLSERALSYIETLSAKLRPGKMPEIMLFRAIKSPVTAIPSYTTVDAIVPDQKAIGELKRQEEEYLEDKAISLRDIGATVTCKVIVQDQGVSSAESIIEAEYQFGADLVVMSTHGRRGITRWAFGSVADKVLRSGKVPVLMVRAVKGE